jgi:hypothetical protein
MTIMADKNTLADYLAELGVDINNMQEFLGKLSMMLTTSSDAVSINQTLQDGTQKTFTVPSFAYLTNKVNSIDTKFNSLLTGNANRIGVMDENGSLRNFELQDVSGVITDLDSVSGKSIINPINFNYKPNWFFESFLNPLLYTDLPVDGIATSDIDRFEATRVIITSITQSDLDYFDSTYKGKNNINYSDLIKDLGSRAIAYFEDSNEVIVPPSQNKVSGSFDIMNMLSDTEARVVLDETQTLTVTKYVLNTLRYMEKATTAPTGVVQRNLKVGDLLITPDNSEYSVTAVDTKQVSVTLERTFGLGELTTGAAKLRIKPELNLIKTVSINLGYNERQVIFLRPISTRLKVTTQNYSQGFGIFTNELTITLTSGEVMTLADFYLKFVSDFSLVFLNYGKEKKIPPSMGETPNKVVLSASDFKVVQIDQHIQADNDMQEVKQNISSVQAIKSQINEVDKQISDKRAQLNTDAALTVSQQLKLNKDLKTLGDSRQTLSTAQSSKVSSITTAVKGTPTLIRPPVYHVKGFWHIPESLTSVGSSQQVVQFKVGYRVLSKTGTSETAEQITFTDPKGNKIVGSFSPWKELISKARSKTYNTTTGFYEWATENVADPNVVNSNQVELPINKGEVLEIRVKSVSEAGWPDNPIESDWSNSILVEFPSNMQTIEDVAVISQQAFAEEAKINFQNDLNAKGLDIHLGTAFTSRDKYFAHRAEDVASGFFATDGSIIDLFSKVKAMSDTLTAIQTSLSSGTGLLKVSIIDQDGNQITVNNGQTIQLFAGYYKDLIKKISGNSTSYDHGKIITNQYILQLENTSQSPLQLIAALNGGTGEKATTSNPTIAASGYDTNLRYDLCPITIGNSTAGIPGGLKQIDGYQSSQVKGQILYRRVKSMNLSENLIDGDLSSSTTSYNPAFDVSYSYAGREVVAGSTVPYAGAHYLPYDPTSASMTIKVAGVNYNLSTNSAVWNGSIQSLAPVGGGLLSEFCIATDHPDLKAGGKYNQAWSTMHLPAITTTLQSTLPFSHAVHFETSEDDSVNSFGAKYFEQAAYRTPSNQGINSPIEYNYPIKQGFLPNDQYLIGKYTCGAYLYISPVSHEAISATSYSPAVSKRIVEVGEPNSIKIPLTFQYRCSDYLKYVGGFRANVTAGLRNIRYTKQVGFDIQLKDDTFSFDVVVSAQYEKETAVVTPASIIAKASKSSSMNQVEIAVQ